MSDASCTACGALDARTSIDGVALCDRCADRAIAEATGWPELPHPRPALTVEGPDGRRHELRFRLWRAPAGIEVELAEADGSQGGGYRFAVLGSHDADADALIDEIVRRARDGIATGQLEPHPYRPGWLLRGERVEGRLVWRDDGDDGGLFDVVVDGRRMTWNDLGQALEPYEGWRFHLVLEEPFDDLRPDAEVIAITGRGSGEEDPSVSEADKTPTIDKVLAEFLAEEEKRLAARTFRNYGAVIHLLRECLNGYGHQSLDADERGRWEAAFEDDDEAFVHLFGPAKIAENLGEFLDYFMIRKVIGGEELLRAAGTVTKRLAKWLGAHGYLDETDVEIAADRAAGAARDLPKAEKLSRLLFELSRTSVDVHGLEDDDYIEDYLMIERVEPGALWFQGDIGPVKVTRAITDLAQPGWSVNIVLGRAGKTWHVLEVGNVYP